jgi:hypothetical protein
MHTAAATVAETSRVTPGPADRSTPGPMGPAPAGRSAPAPTVRPKPNPRKAALDAWLRKVDALLTGRGPLEDDDQPGRRALD